MKPHFFRKLFCLVVLCVVRPISAQAQVQGDVCKEISQRIAQLPLGGGIVDVRSSTRSRSCAVDPFRAVSKPVQILLGQMDIQSSVLWSIPSNVNIEGQGPDKTALIFRDPAAELPWALWIAGSTNVRIANLTLRGSDAPGVREGVAVLPGGRNIQISHVRFENIGHVSTERPHEPITAIAADGVSELRIEDSEFVGTGPARSTARASYEVLAGYQRSDNSNFHILRNTIHASNAAFSIALFDTRHSEVTSNWIDQNNRRWLARGEITSVARKAGTITVSVPDTSEMYAGGDVGSSVVLNGTNSPLDGDYSPVAVKVIDDRHFSFRATGDDVEAHSGGSWFQSANNDGYGVMFYTTVRATRETACQDNTIQGNTIRHTSGNGILLQGSSSTVVSNNELTDTDMQEVAGSHPAGAIAVNAGNPSARVSSVVVISGNKINSVLFNGIDVANSEGISIFNNDIQGIRKGYGIRLRGAEAGAAIALNRVTGGKRGISADGALARATITQNRIADWDGGGGIVISGDAHDVVVKENTLSTRGEGSAIIFSSQSAARNEISDNDISGPGGELNAVVYRGMKPRILRNKAKKPPSDPGTKVNIR